MPARSKVATLPPEVRAELDRRLVEGAFGGYDELAAWLAEQGIEVSRSSIHRHGQALERKVEAIRLATEQAQAIVAGAPDDESAVSEATIRLAQERLFTILTNTGDNASLKEVAAAARAISEMARAGISVSAERRKALTEAAEAAGEAAGKAGLSSDTAAAIRAAIEGVPAA